jgi:hypothetical protein
MVYPSFEVRRLPQYCTIICVILCAVFYEFRDWVCITLSRRHCRQHRITGRIKAAKGSPKNPMTYEEGADKFRANAEFAKWPVQKAEYDLLNSTSAM